jgi:hypothetical protein
MSHPWFRVYSELVDDRKLTRAARETGLSRMAVLGAWTGLLCLANDSPERGRLLLTETAPLTLAEIAETMGTDTNELDPIITAFVGLGMVTWDGDTLVVCQWSERQFESDSSTERVRRYRERQAEQDETPEPEPDGGDMERSRNVTVTPPEAETEAYTETEAEEMGADAPPPEPPAPKPKPSRKSRSAADPRTQHPAIQACKRVRGRYPNKDVYPVVIGALGDNPDIDKLRGCYQEWRVRGYNPDNMGWAVDWYVNGIVKPQPRASPTAGKQADIAKRADMIRRFAQGGGPDG